MIASREMAAKPAAIWKALKEEGAVVVTKNGQPEGVFLATSAETWLEDVQDVVFARARRATRQVRRSAAGTGGVRCRICEVKHGSTTTRGHEVEK